MASTTIDRLDGLSSSTAIKGPCRVATTANITLSGTQTIDGVAVVAEDRVLVKDQSTASENGIWVVDTGAWRRAKDFSGNRDVKTGTRVFVTGGTVNFYTEFFVSTTGAIVIGTTSIAFTARTPVSDDAPEGVLRPEDFGTIGVSAAGDTAAWVALVTVANAMDRVIVEANGEYDIADGTVVFDSIERIELRLAGSVFRQQSSLSKTIRFNSCGKVKITGGTFYGYAQIEIDAATTPSEYNGASTSFNGVSALYFDTCDHVEIDGVRCINHAGGSINGRTTSNAWIHNCHLQGIGEDYIDDGDNGSDFGISFQTASILLDFGYVFLFTNNVIFDHAFGIQVTATKSCVIADNAIGPCWGQHGVYGIDTDGFVVTGNRFDRCRNFGVKTQLENYAGRLEKPAWVTATAYAVGDEVRESDVLYECLEAHTSGTFATDLAAVKWVISSKNYRSGLNISNNIMTNCGLGGVGVIEAAVAAGSYDYFKGGVISGNMITDCGQDGINADRIVDGKIFGNVIVNATRFGIRPNNFSGEVNDNYIKGAGASGIDLAPVARTTLARNQIIDCGLITAGTEGKYPIWSRIPTTIIPGFSSSCILDLDGNKIWFTTGDAASSQLVSLHANHSVRVWGTKTNSALQFRVNGTLLYAEHNEFHLFSTAGHNTPTTFLEGRKARHFYGQQNPSAAGSTDQFYVGDLCWNSAVAAAGVPGWICTTAGTPGTWKAMAAVAA